VPCLGDPQSKESKAASSLQSDSLQGAESCQNPSELASGCFPCRTLGGTQALVDTGIAGLKKSEAEEAAK
jgi:hypothetical protein